MTTLLVLILLVTVFAVGRLLSACTGRGAFYDPRDDTTHGPQVSGNPFTSRPLR